VEGKSQLSLSDEDRNLSCGPEHLFGSTKNQAKCAPLVDSDGGTNKLSRMQSAATQDVQRYFAKHLIESL